MCEQNINNEKIILVKPQTYMNSSGDSIIQVVNFYKVPSENIIVIYDDKEGIKLIKADTKFTVLALYKLGFSWPIVDDSYLDRIFKYVKEIGMYD